ncbi:MAG: rhodanese-like domain-containing protein [Gammaproteobacteria bacterium]|nr:rhodanese-like domain-containing protein [Gammaproteobacteria bacterium]
MIDRHIAKVMAGFLVALTGLGIVLPAWGQVADPATIIDAEQMIDLINAKPDLLIIDSRLAADHKRGFIEGSAALTDTDTNCRSLATLISSKHRPLVFYCNGPKCKRSKAAIAIAKSCGYDQLYWFRGGMEEWIQKKYIYNKNE